MCLVGHEGNLMDWDDVRRMMADGKRDEIERQIAWSREAFVPRAYEEKWCCATVAAVGAPIQTGDVSVR